MKTKRIISLIATVCCIAVLLSSCGSSAAFSTYVNAYNKVSAKGGMNANLTVSLNMNGEKVDCTGSFKVDTSSDKTLLFYELNVGEDKITQFSDGEYIYTDDDTHKSKFALESTPEDSEEKKVGKSEADTAFNSSEFLKEFSGFLEAGKIRELGLMSPLDSSVVSKTTVEGNEYTLTVSESLIKRMLNTMVTNETGKNSSETLQIDELKDFTYKATIENDVGEKVEYSGTVVVNVPANLMSSGEATVYNLEFVIVVDFIDPGNAVTVTIPSGDDYQTPGSEQAPEKVDGKPEDKPQQG